MARFKKIKFLIILKSNFNGGQFYKKILDFDYYRKEITLFLFLLNLVFSETFKIICNLHFCSICSILILTHLFT